MADRKYDLSFLKRISNEDQVFIVDMLETFRNTAPDIIQKMQLYLDQKRYEALSREAHRFIPGVSFLGVKDLEKDLVEIEENAKNLQNLDTLPLMLERVKEAVGELIRSFVEDFNLKSC
ncbi:MAG: Hpt domain-containing protein [Bacteroidales bacterium]|nr:Hpt domain-containing protein [Bacteroidales bacterium]